MITKKEFDHVVLDIEILLISVVQGVALTFLVTNASDPISNLQFVYWPYVAAGFLLILMFWSQAIIHTISFIDWPINLPHSFLYFLAAFAEVMIFNQMTNPLYWFAFTTLFFVVGGLLYFVDLRIIKSQRKRFLNSTAREKVYQHIVARQLFELKILVPGGLLYNVLSFLLIFFYPGLFIEKQYHIILACIQVLLSFVLLGNSLKSFTERTHLLTGSIVKEKH